VAEERRSRTYQTGITPISTGLKPVWATGPQSKSVTIKLGKYGQYCKTVGLMPWAVNYQGTASTKLVTARPEILDYYPVAGVAIQVSRGKIDYSMARPGHQLQP